MAARAFAASPISQAGDPIGSSAGVAVFCALGVLGSSPARRRHPRSRLSLESASPVPWPCRCARQAPLDEQRRMVSASGYRVLVSIFNAHAEYGDPAEVIQL